MADERAAPVEEEHHTSRERAARPGWIVLVRDIAVIVAVALIVSLLVKTFLIRSFYIPSESMYPTLEKDDRILVDQITPRFGSYSRGDVVVFQDPGGWLSVPPQPERPAVVEGLDWMLSLVGLAAPDSDEHLVKRVIGVAGDHVICCDSDGDVTVNGTPIDEDSYLNLDPGQTAPRNEPYNVVVPDGSLWVLGDNRDNSADSRFHLAQPSAGFVPLDRVIGRAFFTSWPLDRLGPIDFHHNVFAHVPAAPHP